MVLYTDLIIHTASIYHVMVPYLLLRVTIIVIDVQHN